MSFKAANNAVKAFFDTAWTAAGYTTVPIAFFNEKFTKPSNSAWLRLTIKPAGVARVELGPDDQKLRTSLLEIEIFYPGDQLGENTINDYIDAIETIFKDQNVSGNRFDDFSLYGPFVAEEGWLRMIVNYTFQRYE